MFMFLPQACTDFGVLLDAGLLIVLNANIWKKDPDPPDPARTAAFFQQLDAAWLPPSSASCETKSTSAALSSATSSAAVADLRRAPSSGIVLQDFSLLHSYSMLERIDVVGTVVKVNLRRFGIT